MIRNADSHNQRQTVEEARRDAERRRYKPSRWDVKEPSLRVRRALHNENQEKGGKIALPSAHERLCEQSTGRLHRSLSHRSRSPTRSREATPEAGPPPPPKMRQWDLGKNMYF